METFKVIKEENGIIISILRCADNQIFTVGDCVDLNFRIKEGEEEGFFIEEFQKETGGNKHTIAIFPRGTIVTNKGSIKIQDAGHVDFESENYLLMNTEYFSIKDMFHLFSHKKRNSLIKLAKEKRDGKRKL